MRTSSLPALATVLALLAGCGSRVLQPADEGNPEETTWRAPASSTAAVDSLESAWRNQDIDAYEQLFTADFVFRRAPTDSGFPRELRRREELGCAGALFNGAPDRPAAESIQLHRMGDLLVGPDPRPGKLGPWRRMLVADYDLTVRTPDWTFRVMSRAAFFAVRGDSARIPPELVELGATPDSTRWYIERWEELEGAAVPPARGLRSLPSTNTTWGDIKVLYLPPPPGGGSGP